MRVEGFFAADEHVGLAQRPADHVRVGAQGAEGGAGGRHAAPQLDDVSEINLVAGAFEVVPAEPETEPDAFAALVLDRKLETGAAFAVSAAPPAVGCGSGS